MNTENINRKSEMTPARRPRKRRGIVAGTLAGAALATLCAADAAHADWIQSVGLGVRASALGGAVVATSDDFDAFYTNPAGAAQFRRPVFGVAVKLFSSNQLRFRDSAGKHPVSSTISELQLAIVPAFGYYHPLNDRLTIGIGFGAPFAIAGDWNKKGGIHRFDMSDQSLIVTDLSPTIAYRVNDRLSIGASLNIVAFKHLRITPLFGDDFLVPDADGKPDGFIRVRTAHNFWLPVPPFDDFNPSFDEVTFTLGFQAQLTDRLRVGASYRHETPTTFKGVVEAELQPFGMLSDRFKLKLHMPGHLQGGFSYQAIPGRLEVSLDVRWTNWSAAQGIGSPAFVQFLDGTLLGLGGLEVDYGGSDTVSVHTGVSYRLRPRVELLAGYVYDPSIFKDNAVDILSYSSDRHILSAGVGYKTGDPKKGGRGWDLTAGFQAILYERRTIAPGTSRNLGGLSSLAFARPGVVTFVPNTDTFQYGGFLWTLGFQGTYRF